MGVIYITHRLEELRAIGDRVTVLRDGQTVHTGPLAELSHRATHPVTWWAARSTAIYHARLRPLRRGTAARRSISRAQPHLHDISFSLRAGEIVGHGRTDRRRPHRTVPRDLRRRRRSTAGEVVRSPDKPSGSVRRARRCAPASR